MVKSYSAKRKRKRASIIPSLLKESNHFPWDELSALERNQGVPQA